MTSLIRRQVLTALIVTAAALLPASAGAEPRILNGTVFAHERLALPPSAMVDVRLIDISRADVPPTTIATTSVRRVSQLPTAYRLRFDSARIVPGRRYGLRARVTVGNHLWFTSTKVHPIFTGGRDRADILVERVASSAKAQTGLTGRWLADDIRGGGVLDGVQTILEMAPDGAVTGSGGCNRISGKSVIAGNRIAFSPLASTRMACIPTVMEQESKFLAALSAVRTWRADPAQRKLMLLDDSGSTILVFSRK